MHFHTQLNIFLHPFFYKNYKKILKILSLDPPSTIQYHIPKNTRKVYMYKKREYNYLEKYKLAEK